MVVPLKKTLPKLPGVYLFKGKDNTIIYVGKAKSIKKRIDSYFSKQNKDWKVDMLLAEYTDIDYVITKTETEALLLEAQLVKDHQPKFNVLLKDGQPYIYLMVTAENIPQLKIVRTKKEKGEYFGPFMHKTPARKVHNYLIRTFVLQICNKKLENGCLDFHLGLCAGTCRESNFSLGDYLFRMQLAKDVLRDAPKDFLKRVQEQIKTYNTALEFEKSKNLTEYLQNLDTIFHTIKAKYSEDKYEDQTLAAIAPIKLTEYEETAHGLQKMLQLDKPPVTIDCFDISHFQSSFLVGSSVRFKAGVPDKKQFRHFNIKTLTQQNDYAALQEIVARRYKDPHDIPDLIVIDGGKGQLNAVLPLLPDAQVVSLAKREETVFSTKIPDGIKLSLATPEGRLLIALRDYTHHFAISFHKKKRLKGLRDDNTRTINQRKSRAHK
jgi:excinuclease ABC subunit C